MYRARFASLAALGSLVLGACAEPMTGPALTPAESAPQSRAADFGLDRAQIRLPASARISDQYLLEMCERAITPGDYQCPPSTPIIAWYRGKAIEVINKEPATANLLFGNLLAHLVPTYEALYFQTDDMPQYFGYDGKYTRDMLKVEKDAKRFWDIDSQDIQLVGMHGSVLLDVERVARTYNQVFGLPAALAQYYATLVRDAVHSSQTLNGGNHPLFSFNAFAISTGGGPIPDKIVIGDGILAGYADLGFGDVAPQAIYAHEFGHHIQFENGYFDDPAATAGSLAERTRYTELMADAMSAYFLTHKRGAAMNRKRVEQFLHVFYQIGDCGFSSPGHHGTPNQRMAAAQFGFEVADQAQKQGHILTSAKFHALFVAKYPELVAPDAR